MKLAYITTDFGIPVHGNKGASIHVRELSAALAEAGHEVEILTCRSGGDAPAGFNVPVTELPLPQPERLVIGSLQDDPAAGEAVAKEVRSMLYATTFRQQALPLLRASRPDAIYERYSLLGTAGGALADDLGVPLLLEVNAPLSEEHARHRGSAFARTIRAIEQRVLQRADHIFAVSEPLKTWIVETGVPSERVSVLPNGVNLARFTVAPATDRRTPGAPVIGFVGTLKAWHGTGTLIRAAGRLARQRGTEQAPRLLIVGDGPQRAELERIAAEEGIGDLVTFTGGMPHEEIPALIAAMDIAVAPYDALPDFYFSPLKLFEYMAAGRPVVAADIGQIAECIRDGETGLLYPPGDAAALADRLASLLDDPARAEALGAAARHDARQRRSWAVNARIVAEQAVRAIGTIHAGSGA